MDSQRFDELTRGLAAARSRREILKALTGAVVAGAGTVMVRGGSAVAQEACTADTDCADDEICCAEVCRAIECCIDEDDPNARCPEGTSCFEGMCDPVETACEDDADCGDDEICCVGTCRAIECCIDEDDPNARCPEGTSCFEGVCDPVVGGDDTDDDDEDDAPTLPSTGAGSSSAGQNAPVSAMLAAGAAAALAARKLLQRSEKAGPTA